MSTNNAKEPKFNGNYKEVSESLTGVLFCGENGGPCVLHDIRKGNDPKDLDIDQYEFVFEVSSYKRPNEGDAAEPIETRYMSSIWTLKSSNQEINIRTINDGLGIAGTKLALKDEPDDHYRLVVDPEDEPNSLVHLIGKPTAGVYLKPTVTTKTGEDVKAIYYNIYAPPARVSAKGKGIKLADLKAKKAKQELPNF